jgi:hypothetical protein
MTAEEFFEKAGRFAGTAYFAFELNNRVLAIGRMREDGPVQLYERDHAAEPMGYRHALATFVGPTDAARAGAFFATLGENYERALFEVGELEARVIDLKYSRERSKA